MWLSVHSHTGTVDVAMLQRKACFRFFLSAYTAASIEDAQQRPHFDVALHLVLLLLLLWHLFP